MLCVLCNKRKSELLFVVKLRIEWVEVCDDGIMHCGRHPIK